MGISFNVSPRYVIADLAPIAYLGLVEYILEEDVEGDGAQEAAIRLYDRMLPLLSCVHNWTRLERAEDISLLNMTVEGGGRPHICKLCTGYAFEGSLPVMGRSFSTSIE